MKKSKTTALRKLCHFYFVALAIYSAYCVYRGVTAVDLKVVFGQLLVVYLIFYVEGYCTRTFAKAEDQASSRTAWGLYTVGQPVTLAEAFDLLYDFPGPFMWFSVRADIDQVYQGSSYLEAYNCLSDLCGSLDETGIPYRIQALIAQPLNALTMTVTVSHLPKDGAWLSQVVASARHKSTQRQ